MVDSLLHLIDSASVANRTHFDFRHIGGPMLAAVSSLYHLSKMTVIHGITEFYATQLISSRALPLDVFNSEVENFIRSFTSTTTREFTRSRQLIRDHLKYNGIMSALYTNFHYQTSEELVDDDIISYEFYSLARIYEEQSSNCSCDNTPFCKNASIHYR